VRENYSGEGTMRIGIKKIAGWGLTLFALATHTVFLACGLLVASIFMKISEYRVIAYLSGLMLFSVIILVAVIVVNVLFKRKGLDKKYWIRGVVLAIFTLNSVLLLSDAKPLVSDYALEDISQPENARLSYEVLKEFARRDVLSFSDEEKRAVLEAPDSENILKDKRIIRKAWKSLEKARVLIGELDLFEGVADFSHVDDSVVLGFSDFPMICAGHEAYARLCMARGDFDEAIDVLSPLNSVARKALPYASLGNKSWWMALRRRNFRIMNDVVLRSNADKKIRERILREFPEMSSEELSFENALIGHYLQLKYFAESSFNKEEFMNYLSFPVASKLDRWERFYNFLLSGVIYPVTVDRNRIIRDLRTYNDLLIETARTMPPDNRKLNIYRQNYHRKPQLGNLAGWLVTRRTMHNTEILFESAAATKALGDLLVSKVSDDGGEREGLREISH